jgi:hypothetical protein
MNGNGRRLAVLIGSPVGGLRGVAADIESMRRELTAWGFECETCVGEVNGGGDAEATRVEPTREWILERLERLRDETGPHDAIVVYYSGHGGRCHLIEHEGDEPRAATNFLVPMRCDRGPSFRGVADFELALLFYEISRKTQNVTVILDCCHAATMVRSDERGELFRSAPEFEPQPQEQVRRWTGHHLYTMPDDVRERHAEYQRRKHELHFDSNPHVVRLVATALGSPAFESAEAGFMTTELCAALADVRHGRAAWDTIVRRVREKVIERRRSTTQRPELEGPRNRLPFSLETGADIIDRGTLVYREADGTAWVNLGRLHGLSRGDELQVLGGEETVVAKAELEEIFDDHARVALETSGGVEVRSESTGERFPASGSVVAVERYTSRESVWVDHSAERCEEIREAIIQEARLIPTEDRHQATFRVLAAGKQLQVEGPPWLHRIARPATPTAIEALVRDLDDVARSCILERQLASPAQLANDTRWEARAFVILPGAEPRRLVEGERLPVGTRVYVELVHAARGAPTLYVNVLDRGVSGRVGLLHPSQPSGIQLRAPEGNGEVIERIPGIKNTMTLLWPSDVPKPKDGLKEELVIVVSERPLDLRNLLMVDPGLRRKRRGDATHSARELSVVPVGGVDPDAGLGQDLCWTVRRAGFVVVP